MRGVALSVATLLFAVPSAAHGAAPQSGVVAQTAAAQATALTASDDFDAGSLKNGIWQLCQADERLLRFDPIAPAEGRYSLTIGVDAARKGEVLCNGPAVAATMTGDESDDIEGLGPSLIEPVQTRLTTMGIFRQGAATVIQRNELRLQNKYHHPIDENYWYGLSFRLDGDIPATGSTRWVIGQWKQTNGSSPILAQRFDNGVFHITVQDGHCRCRIAKAGGDPNLAAAPLSSNPLQCIWTPDTITKDQGGDPKEGDACPTELSVIRGEDSVLPDPKVDWVNMIYAIRGGRDGNGRIDIYTNGRFVARVTGPIGYDNWRGQKVKFKIGMYRDFLPGIAQLHLDRFWLGRDPAVYEPGFKPRP